MYKRVKGAICFGCGVIRIGFWVSPRTNDDCTWSFATLAPLLLDRLGGAEMWRRAWRCFIWT